MDSFIRECGSGRRSPVSCSTSSAIAATNEGGAELVRIGVSVALTSSWHRCVVRHQREDVFPCAFCPIRSLATLDRHMVTLSHAPAAGGCARFRAAGGGGSAGAGRTATA